MFGLNLKKELEIYSPIEGECIELNKVNDEVFSQKMMGEGIAFKVDIGTVYAPCDCEVSMLFPTLHAIGIKSKNVEILIHVGLETVSLNGKGFESFVQVGQKLKQGQEMIKFDLEVLKENNIDSTTMMIITSKYQQLEFIHYGKTKPNDKVLKVKL